MGQLATAAGVPGQNPSLQQKMKLVLFVFTFGPVFFHLLGE